MGCGNSKNVDATLALPQTLTPEQQKERAKALAQVREEYELYYPYGGKDSSPAWIKNLPSREETTAQKAEFMTRIGILGYLPTKAESTFREMMSKWTACINGRAEEIKQDPFRKYNYLYAEDELPEIAHTWRTDASFADQRMNGLYPDFIDRCREVPAGFAEQAESIIAELGLMPAGTTLASAAADGLLYQTDLRPYVKGAPGREDNDIVTSPLALFYSDVPNKRLVPLAIQLQVGGTVFTPQDDADGSNRWLVAKMHVNRAQWSLYVSVTHWLYIHQVLGRMYTGMRRQIADEHPLWKLIARHFDNHLGAMETAKTVEDFDNRRSRFQGMTEWTRAASLPGGHFAWLNVPANFESRGVMDEAKLPGFHYRNQGMKHWAAHEQLVTSVIYAIYATDEDVAADYELQEWVADITGDEGGITGLPLNGGKITKRADLIRILTSMIFNVATKHTLTLTAGMDYYAYIPNAPTVLAVEPPTDHERRYTDEEICAGLPSDKVAIEQFAGVKALQVYDIYPLLPLESDYLSGIEGGKAIADTFVAAMDKIAKETPKEYTYLAPKYNGVSAWN